MQQQPAAGFGFGFGLSKSLVLHTSNLVSCVGRYTCWVAESDTNTRVKSARCPFERSHFYCQRLISRFVASLEILADQTPDLLGLAATV
jgi:hypothetical protein